MIGVFFAKRWLRLFPAMLICSALVFVTAPLFPERPAGLPAPPGPVPGLTFIDPAIWQKIIGGTQGSLEGVLVAVRRNEILRRLWSALFLAREVVGNRGALRHLPLEPRHGERSTLSLSSAGQPHNFLDSWELKFMAGLRVGHFYRYFSDRKLPWLLGGIAISLVSAGEMSTTSTIAATRSRYSFAGSLMSRTVQLLLSARWLVFGGFISYPLYLLHENMLVSGMVKLGVAMPNSPSLLSPILPALGLICLAWLVASYLEPRVKNSLQKALGRLPHRSTSHTEKLAKQLNLGQRVIGEAW